MACWLDAGARDRCNCIIGERTRLNGPAKNGLMHPNSAATLLEGSPGAGAGSMWKAAPGEIQTVEKFRRRASSIVGELRCAHAEVVDENSSTGDAK